MKKIIITGANGFIGSHVTDIFCKNRYKVGCYVRKNSNLQRIKHLDIKMHYGDIREELKLSEAFQGYDGVIHIAALVSDWGEYKDFYEINVNGTMNVLGTCKKNNIRNIILTGSCSVYGEENNENIKNENSPLNSHYKYFLDNLFPSKMNYYRDTKRIAKEKAIKYAKDNNLNVTFIEPVWVFGEGEFNTGFYEYLKTAKTKLSFLPGTENNNFHVIYVKDLARSYLLALQKKLKGINCFLIGNNKVEKMNNIYKIFCREAGFKKPMNLSKWLVYPIGFILELFYILFNFKKPPILSRSRVNMFFDNIEYSTKKAKEVLGFENHFGLEDAIKKTVNWYKQNNFI